MTIPIETLSHILSAKESLLIIALNDLGEDRGHLYHFLTGQLLLAKEVQFMLKERNEIPSGD